MRTTAWVRHDRLDDEAMVIDVESGSYYAFTGAAADAWTLLAGGHETDEVGRQLAKRYGVDVDEATPDAESFALELAEEKLLEAGASAHPADLSSAGRPGPYVAPVIERHDELADLLLVDPIHEVEPSGWPVGRQD